MNRDKAKKKLDLDLKVKNTFPHGSKLGPVFNVLIEHIFDWIEEENADCIKASSCTSVVVNGTEVKFNPLNANTGEAIPHEEIINRIEELLDETN